MYHFLLILAFKFLLYSFAIFTGEEILFGKILEWRLFQNYGKSCYILILNYLTIKLKETIVTSKYIILRIDIKIPNFSCV